MRTIKLFLCLSIGVLFASNVVAKEVNKTDAERVAKNHYYEISATRVPYERILISKSYDIKSNSEVVYYAFDMEEGGYVVVSAEDQFTPIIAYSDHGTFLYEDAPAHYQWLMDEYANMINYVRANHIDLNAENSEKWERLMSHNPEMLQHNRATAVIGPLVGDITWNQDYPYNYYAPVDLQSPAGKRAYAGCVATAMSIVLYYWRWPLQGEGEHSYTPGPIAPGCPTVRYPIQSANFGETHYDYDGMTYAADKVVYEPLALLMYHCGVAVDMRYCWDGSGTQTGYIANAAKKYFKYDPSISEYPKTTTAAWTARLKEDLDKYRPMCIGGTEPGANSGHAFVCDGYDTNNMFHFNFGWSGSGDGYFAADNPDGYSSNLRAIVNMFPDASKGYPYDCSRNVVVPCVVGTITDCGLPYGKYSANINSSWLIDPAAGGTKVEKITLTCDQMELAAGDYIRIYKGSDATNLVKEVTGTETFTPIEIEGETVYITFTSAAASPGGNGFRIFYKGTCVIYCPTTTIQLTDCPQGFLTDGSPEDMDYGFSSSCKWEMNQPGATSIFFQFEYLETEPETDFIRIVDITNNKLVGTYSGWGYTPTTLPQIPAVEAQRLQITFTANAAGGNKKGFKLNYYLEGTCASIKENDAIDELNVYPNPTTALLNVSFSSEKADDINIELYTITGQRVYQETLNQYVGKYFRSIDVNTFAKGIYLMHITSSKGSSVRKVVIQ